MFAQLFNCLHVRVWSVCVLGTFVCMCNHLCPCDLLTGLAWATITRAKADTTCYSSLVLHSPHSGSECPAPFSLFHLFTSFPPSTPAQLSAVSLTLSKWPPAVPAVAYMKTTALLYCMLTQHVCKCLACVHLIKKHACKLQTEMKAHLSTESVNTSHSLRGGGESIRCKTWVFSLT